MCATTAPTCSSRSASWAEPLVFHSAAPRRHSDLALRSVLPTTPHRRHPRFRPSLRASIPIINTDSAAGLHAKYTEPASHCLPPVLRRRLDAYLDVERASILAAQRQWLGVLSYLARSFLRAPRLTLHLERFWRHRSSHNVSNRRGTRFHSAPSRNPGRCPDRTPAQSCPAFETLLVPLFDFEVPIRGYRRWCRNFNGRH